MEELYGIQGAWKDSGFVRRNQVSWEGIRFHRNKSGFVGWKQVLLVALRIWCDDDTIRNELVVAYMVWLGLNVIWNE
jgi:hypothetical protein